MKKIFSALLCLCLLMVNFTVLAEDLTQYFDFFISRYGNIVFTMNDAPKIAWDQDLLHNEHPEKIPLFFGWKNKTQLHYSDSDGEWQYHLADVSLMMEEIRAAYPEETEKEIQRRTILNFMDLCRMISGASCGTVPQGEISWKDYPFGNTFMYGATGDFEYGDLPGVTYQCMGILDGTNAVVLMGTKDERYAAMADALSPITPEKEALLYCRSLPSAVTAGSITLSFPMQYEQYATSSSYYYCCFTPEYNYILLEYMPFDMASILPPEGNEEDHLLEIAQLTGDQLVEEDVVHTVEVSVFSPGVILLSTRDKEPFGAVEINNYFYTMDGVYCIAFLDMEDGWAVMENISFQGKTLNTIKDE